MSCWVNDRVASRALLALVREHSKGLRKQNKIDKGAVWRFVKKHS